MPPTQCFIITSNSKSIITKSNYNIISKSGINDAKSVDDLMRLMVGSPINAGHFNKRRQPTGLITCIYYMIRPPRSLATVTNGWPTIANNFILVQPHSRGSPLYAELRSVFFFQYFRWCASSALFYRDSSDSHWWVSATLCHLTVVTELHHQM